LSFADEPTRQYVFVQLIDFGQPASGYLFGGRGGKVVEPRGGAVPRRNQFPIATLSRSATSYLDQPSCTDESAKY
jgi:hypothetical protein